MFWLKQQSDMSGPLISTRLGEDERKRKANAAAQSEGMHFLRTFPSDGSFAGTVKFSFPSLGAITKKKSGVAVRFVTLYTKTCRTKSLKKRHFFLRLRQNF